MPLKYIFTVGKEKELSHTAAALGHLFYPYDSTNIINLNEIHALESAQEESIETLITLGHSNTKYYGNFTAHDFCIQFAKQFTENQKRFVKHLYLIGCEVGLVKNGQSIAQEVADELYKLGFTNIQLHSIAKPEDAVGEFMYVEIIDHAGIAAFRNVREGYINAYLLRKEAATLLNKLLKNRQHNNDEVERIIREQAFIFIKESNPVEELNKPNNIFVPNEIENVRKNRIENHFYSVLSEEQKLAINLIRQRRDYEIRKGNKKIAAKLNLIMNQLAITKPQDVETKIRNFLRFFRFRMLGITLNSKSKTLKLLENLSESKLVEAQKIIKKQAIKDKINSDVQEEFYPVTAFFSQPAPVSLSNEDKIKNKLEARKTNQLRCAKKEIAALIKHLDDEIIDLKQGCFFFLNRYEINTKREKRKALKELLTITDFNALQIKASDFILNHERVMRSKKTSRTKHLLETIVNNPAQFAVKATRDIKIKYGYG